MRPYGRVRFDFAWILTGKIQNRTLGLGPIWPSRAWDPLGPSGPVGPGTRWARLARFGPVGIVSTHEYVLEAASIWNFPGMCSTHVKQNCANKQLNPRRPPGRLKWGGLGWRQAPH